MASRKPGRKTNEGTIVQFPTKGGKRPRIQFVYKFPDTYNPVYSNGAYGGMSTQRDFVINFYHERPPVPYSITQEVNPDGGLGSETAREPKTDDPIVLRYVTTGVVMDLGAAKRLHEWLGRHITTSEGILAQGNKGNEAKKKPK